MIHRICRARGRLTFKCYIITVAILIFISSVGVHLFSKFYQVSSVSPVSLQSRTLRHLSKIVTVVFRHLEDFDNDVADSVQSVASTFPYMPVIVLCDNDPYPPFIYPETNETLKNVKVLSLKLRLNASPQELNPLTHIVTDFVLFVPDSSRVSRRVLQKAVMALSNAEIIAIPIGNSHIICQKVTWNYADWSLQYSKMDSDTLCDAVFGQHAVLIKKSLLHALPKPFGYPFPELLYLQSFVRNVKVKILDGKFGAGHNNLKVPTVRQRALRQLRDQRLALYKEIGVKAVIREDGRVQWFGCRRETPRCFPPVQGTPSFVLAGRNTPPCCRRNIRRVAAHVLRLLTQAGVRCWLETTSLLGAVVRGDLLPWAEYAEIGIHASDVSRVSWLQRGGTDPDGFVWERATKGHYYRVAYSNTNRVYTLVLPFSAKNGTMWPADWVLAHQKEFPERHLHPLAQIQFAGHQAPAPNDARAFLDLKLGVGSVEKCDKLGPKLLY